MSIFQILILAVIQGLAELLPVSSSAHVIVAEKLMGLKPSSPEMTFQLVMLHTGTMLAVIVYFWSAWRRTFFSSAAVFKQQAGRLVIATALTGFIGGPLLLGIPRIAGKLGFVPHDSTAQTESSTTATTAPTQTMEVESLFDNLPLIAISLAAAGGLILFAGAIKQNNDKPIEAGTAAWIGAVQGLCLPFRGFSRSGATISTALIRGAIKQRAEEFSFALAVIITPAAIAMEGRRLLHHNSQAGAQPLALGSLLLPGLLGLVFSFLAGLVALKILSRVLENGKWYLFGVYCLVAAAGVMVLSLCGY